MLCISYHIWHIFQGDMDFDIYTHAVYYNVCWKFTKIYVILC